MLFRSALSLLLTVNLLTNGSAKEPVQRPLSKNQRILHVVERLTFGARPADLDQAAKVGVEKWIEDQLHPERIPENPLLAGKLASLETLQLPVGDLLRKYPSNASLALMATGVVPRPEDPLLRRGVDRAIERYRARQKDGKAATAAAETEDPGTAFREAVSMLGASNARVLRAGKPEEKNALLRSLPAETIDRLLLALPPGPLLRAIAANGPTEVRRKAILVTAPQQVIAFDLNENRLQRAIYSNRQLEELLVDFWYNHFNVFLEKGADRQLVPSYERDAIRPYVLGKFRDMLGATAQHPAMLFYLDNWQSVAPREGMRVKRGLNENYARELMELHTLGVDGGYTQKDVTEVARCLTGWTIREPRRSAEFLFNERTHDKGLKTVLGVNIPAGGGKEDGDRVLDIVAAHPSTAKFISRKLALRFVSDAPSDALVSQMAGVFQKTGGDLREVMRTMLRSKEFLSEGAFRAKVKTPFEMVASAARALDAEVSATPAMARELTQLGEPLYRKVEPTGYSWRNADWVNSSALLGRMNVALSMAQGKLQGVEPHIPADSNSWEALEKRYVPAGLSEATRKSIAKAVEQKDTTPATIAGLLLGSPEFQRK